jgi:branched-chain amino acid transport system substrate-binding protein
VLLLACCAFLLISCQVPGTVRPTVKIGLVAPFEGRYRYVGYDAIYAVRLALRQANAAGGVGGYSVELVAYDDQADPVMAIEQVRKLAADPGVVAVIGHFDEKTTVAARSAYVDAGLPLVAPAVLDPALTPRKTEGCWICRLGPPAETVADALLRQLDRSEYRHFALVTDGGPLGVAVQQGAHRHGLHVWPNVSPQDADWLHQVKDTGSQVVLCDASPVVAGEIVASLREAGWSGTVLGGPQLAASDFAAVAGQAAEGVTFVTPWPFPPDAPAAANFATAYRSVSNDLPPGPLAAPAYEAAWVLLEALQRDIAAHGMPTRHGMAAVILATERQGVLGPIDLDAGRSWTHAPLYWYRIDGDGTPELLP